MITHLHGKLIEKTPTHVIVECNGVGYFLHISLHTFSQLKDQEHLCLYTHLLVKEDAHTLFGFAEQSERELFRLLLSVSGVGPGTARTVLSSRSPAEVREAIAQENVAAIQAVKGIGAKTAQRVILDLKDKVLKICDIGEVSPRLNNTSKEEALSALEVLGFSRKPTEKVVNQIVAENPSLQVEDIIKRALKNL